MAGMLQQASAPARIREANSNEARRLYEIDRLCFPDFMAYSWPEMIFYLRHPQAVNRVAELDGATVGFAIGRVGPHLRAHVITLDVILEARRRKIGTMLMLALHEEFCRRGMTESVLEVDALNEAAHRFYLGLGYGQQELLRGYYRNRRDAFQMILRLQE
jgi:ribosomal protein S18 acetylase RimI-like enzyme